MKLAADKSIDQLSRELLAGATGLARAAQRVLRWQAVLWCLATAVAALAVLLVGDMLLRREELGLRILSLLAWIAAVLWGVFRWLRPAWRFSPTPREVAVWIEHRQPKFSGQLSTAVELAALPAEDVRYGSRGFREAALQECSVPGIMPDWRQHLDTRPVRQAAMVCAGVLLLLLGLLLGWPTETRLALTRMVMPWSINQWPQRDQLAFRDPPAVVALGSELQLEVIDNRPPLPDRVQLQIRSAGNAAGAAATSSLETIQVNEVAVGNLPAVTTAIEVRAVGGDDRSMAWHRIQVVQAPELLEYHFQVQPPAYSGLPVSEVVGRRIGVLAGSQVEFRGRFSEPMRQVTVLSSSDQSTQASAPPLPGAEAAADDRQPGRSSAQTAAAEGSPASSQWSARLESDAHWVRIGGPAGAPLTIEQSLSWQLAIVTDDGLKMQLPERWSIEVTEDAPPHIVLQSADLPELAVDAQLAVRGAASDDLGLVEVVARLGVDGADSQQPAAGLSIWSAALAAKTLPEEKHHRDLVINQVWNLAQAAKLMPGQRIAVWLEARDTGGQWSRSAVQEFTIRDPQDLVDSIQQKQNQLLGKLRELVDTQRRNNQLFTRAAELMQQSQEVQREQLDLFRRVAQVQRAIEQQFQSRGDSDNLVQDVAKLRELLTQNRLEASELAQELDVLQDTITQLGTGPLRSATQASDASFQQSQTLLSEQGPATAAHLAVNDRTTSTQSEALRGLESLLDRLARNEAVQQVQRELAQILNQQNALRLETDQLQLERLSATNDDQLQAKQTALAADQQGLARRLDDLVRRAGELQAAASPDQQSLRTQLERATESLTGSQASARMRRSTEEIRSDRLAQAATTQQEVAQLLEQSLQELGAGSTSQRNNLQNRADGLRQSEQELSRLAEQQAALAERWSGPMTDSRPQPLVREQADLQQQTSQQASQAAQAGDASLASQLERTVHEQQAAGSAGQQSDFQQAAQAAGRAADQLAQSAEQLRQRAEQLEQQVAEQQLSELTAAVGQLAADQRPVAEQFDALSQASAQADAAKQQAEIRAAATRQETVRQSLREVRGQTSKLPTFDWTLQQAEAAMSRAVAAAQRYRIQPDANEAAADALQLLELAAAAMRNDAASPAGENADPTTADSSPPSDSDMGPAAQSPPIPIIASLKLLRALQQEINARTIATEATADDVRRSQKLIELSSLQQALGQQIEQLQREFAAANDTGEN